MHDDPHISPSDSPVAVATDSTDERQRVGDHVVLFRTSSSPRWYLQFNQDGRQYKLSLKTTNKKNALVLAKSKEAELTLGVAKPPTKRAPTIAEAAQSYVDSLRGRRRDEKTLSSYRTSLDGFVQYAMTKGITRLTHITAELLEEHQRDLQKVEDASQAADKTSERPRKANAPNTARRKLRVVRQLLKWAVKRRIVSEDPAPGYQLPPEIKPKIKLFTADELHRIITEAEPPYKEIFNFLRVTGLRSEEFSWLTKADVDTAFRFIRIRAKACPFTDATWRPKHGNERIVPLDATGAAIARRLLETSPGPWLFYNDYAYGRQRGRYSPGTVRRALKLLLARLGIKHGTVHVCRHGYCSFLANRKVSPFKVMKYMGHSSLDIVLTYYDVSEDELLTGLDGVDFNKMLVAPKGEQSREVSGNNINGGSISAP